ncbi:unnamed protein product, partial [Ectocarpus sp. 12 AP-2014]
QGLVHVQSPGVLGQQAGQLPRRRHYLAYLLACSVEFSGSCLLLYVAEVVVVVAVVALPHVSDAFPQVCNDSSTRRMRIPSCIGSIDGGRLGLPHAITHVGVRVKIALASPSDESFALHVAHQIG